MEMNLEGKPALVSGSTMGIGEALAGEGVAVAVNGRHQDEVDGVVEEIGTAGGTAHGLLADLATTEAASGRSTDREPALIANPELYVRPACGRVPA